MTSLRRVIGCIISLTQKRRKVALGPGLLNSPQPHVWLCTWAYRVPLLENTAKHNELRKARRELQRQRRNGLDGICGLLVSRRPFFQASGSGLRVPYYSARLSVSTYFFASCMAEYTKQGEWYHTVVN